MAKMKGAGMAERPFDLSEYVPLFTDTDCERAGAMPDERPTPRLETVYGNSKIDGGTAVICQCADREVARQLVESVNGRFGSTMGNPIVDPQQNAGI